MTCYRDGFVERHEAGLVFHTRQLKSIGISTMSRKKIGLALSGGGARGFAHVGVLKVLAENNIPIDFIAGTSIGSLVGGAFAAGMSANEIEKMAHSVRWRHMIRPSFSPTALWSNAPMGKFIERHFPAKNFEELALPFAAVTCDLMNEVCVVLKDKGDVVSAIRASCAVPAIFAPIRENGRMLVDGGVVAPVPIDAVKDLGADIVIAVDLLSCGSGFRRYPSTVIGMLFLSAMVLVRSLTDNQQNTADLTIVPDIAHIRPDRLNQREDCLRLGEEAARAKIDEIKRLISGQDFAR
jgi:NTE family protein